MSFTALPNALFTCICTKNHFYLCVIYNCCLKITGDIFPTEQSILLFCGDWSNIIYNIKFHNILAKESFYVLQPMWLPHCYKPRNVLQYADDTNIITLMKMVFEVLLSCSKTNIINSAVTRRVSAIMDIMFMQDKITSVFVFVRVSLFPHHI